MRVIRVTRVTRIRRMSDFYRDCIIETAYLRTGLNAGLDVRADSHPSSDRWN